ncbi:MAG TPA: secretin N-terminal domain-containing protein, partial [Planctomycetota bacterium]|nr:secretin N-terminal domain-containing protein [Planctomycetota bacterium]
MSLTHALVSLALLAPLAPGVEASQEPTQDAEESGEAGQDPPPPQPPPQPARGAPTQTQTQTQPGGQGPVTTTPGAQPGVPPGAQPGPQAQPQPGAQPGPQGQAQPGAQAPPVEEVGDYYILRFDEVADAPDLEWLTKLTEQVTGINFTYDDTTAADLKSKRVRLLGTKRIPKSDFYNFYQILMFINQYILTKVGPEHLAVVLVQQMTPARQPQNQVRNESLYVLPEDLEKYADQVATQVITVLHLPHTEVRTLGNSLRQLFVGEQTQGLLPVGQTNSVILQGFASNIASLARILKLVDQEAARDIGVKPVFEVIPLEFAAAEDMADVLEQLLEAATRVQQQQIQANPQGATGQIRTGGTESKILTDPRTNSLLVMALPEDMQRIKELIARLDVEVVEPERTYHVYALENVKAEELVEVLNDFIQGASRVGGGGAGGQRRPDGQAVQTVTPGGTSRDAEIVVVADKATNAILIAASKRRDEELVDLIQRLDRRQDQVLIETALIELTGSTSLDLGVELGFADLPGTSGTGGFGVTNFGLGTFLDTDNDGIPDVKVPNTNLGVTAGILDGDDFALPVLISALRNRRDTNVLNVPSVLVNNNGSAEVRSTDSQPTTTITLGVQGAGAQENFQGYQDAGITMQISPSISAGGYLRLDVFLEVSTFQGTFSGPIPPPKLTRTIHTVVNVPDGDTMVV